MDWRRQVGGLAFGIAVFGAWQIDQDKEVKRGILPGTPETSGVQYALVIGISRYQAPTKLVPPLRYADRDASDFASFLRSPRGGFRTRPPVLTNANAKLGNIRNTIDFAFKDAKAGDIIHVFISAHGVTAGGESYLVTHDAFAENTRDSGYPASELQQRLTKWVKAGVQVRLYVDACRSGDIADIPEKKLFNRTLTGSSGVYALMASDFDSKAYEHEEAPNVGNGVFTHFLLAGLNASQNEGPSKNSAGQITADGLFEYVRANVRSFTRNAQTPIKARIGFANSTPIVNTTDAGTPIPSWTRTFRPLTPREFDTPSQGEKEGLSPDLERLIALDNEGQQLLIDYMRGDEMALPKSHYDNGARLYGEAVRLNPDSNILRSKQAFFEGRALLFDKPKQLDQQRQQLEKAIARLLDSVRLNPDGAYAHNGLGIAYLEAGNFPAAIRSLDEAIRLAPYWAYPRHNRALALQQQGNYQRAAADYERGMQLGPGYSYLAYNLGLLYQRTNQLNRAERSYREALSRRDPALPPLASAWTALGTLAAAKGKGRDAEAYYEKATALLPLGEAKQEVMTLRHNRGLLYAEYEKKPLKLRRWRSPVELWEDNIAAEFLPSALAIVEYWERRGDWQRMRESSARVVALAPENLAAQLNQIRADGRLGRFDQARRALAELAKSRPKHPALVRVETELNQVERRKTTSRARLGQP